MSGPTTICQDKCGSQAGGLMVRHVIDGHVVYLPADAVLSPRLAPDDEIDIDTIKLSGTFE